jgi:TolA-binding protein
MSLLNQNTIRMNFVTLVLCATALASGCSKPDTSAPPPDAAKQLDKLKADTKEAAQDLKDFTYAQKAQFTENMQTRLNALNQDLDRLSAKIDSASEAVKAQASPKLQALRDQVGQLKGQLNELKDANESTWDSVKAKAQKAYADLKAGCERAQQWVSDKLSS